jgi:hypothetical protein
MHSRGSPCALVRIEPPTEISKEDFLRFLGDTVKKSEVSWVTTDVRSFEWDEINLNKSMFVKQLDSLRFKKAFVGIFDSSTKRMEYFAFNIK